MLDKKDIEILKALSRNAKKTMMEISKETGIPITTVYNRIRRMEEKGIIKGTRPVIDYSMLGKKLSAIVKCRLDYSQANTEGFNIEKIAKNLTKKRCVEKAMIVTGDYDIILDCFFRDVDEMRDFLFEMQQSGLFSRTSTLVKTQVFEKGELIDPF